MDPYNFASPEEYQAEQRAIERRRRLAEMLGQQAVQPMQGQMVGRVYVPPSPVQGLAQMLTAYGARKRLDSADTQEAAAASAYQDARRQALAQALQGGQVNAQQMLANPFTADIGAQLVPLEIRGQQQASRDAERAAREAQKAAEDRAWREQQAASDRDWRAQQAQMQADLRRDLAAQAAAGRDKPEKPPAGYRENPDGTMTAIPGGPADPSNPLNANRQPKTTLNAKEAATAKQKIQQAQMLRSQIAAARERFAGIKDTMSAGLGGNLLPTEKGQQFDAAVDALRSTVTGLRRVPGVGAMSDYETRLDQASIPSRGKYESVTEQQLDQLEQLADGIERGYSDILGEEAGVLGVQPPASGPVNVVPPGATAPGALPGGWSVRVK